MYVEVWLCKIMNRTEESNKISDCATSIIFVWFEAFFNVHTNPYPKPIRPHLPLPLKKYKYIIGSNLICSMLRRYTGPVLSHI